MSRMEVCKEEKEYYTLIDLSFCRRKEAYVLFISLTDVSAIGSITPGEKDDSRVGTKEDH